jgi:uncharacterized protein involved in exopolysaccharide biosynthesis
MFGLLKKILGITLLPVGLAIFIFGAKTFFDSSRYKAIARIGVEQQTAGDNLAFIKKQYEIILSDAVLGRAAESVNLNAEWFHGFGSETNLQTGATLTKLRKRLGLVPIHNTKLLQIEFRSEQPKEAAAIANAIAKAYLENRATAFQEATNKRIGATDIARVKIVGFAEVPESPMPMGQIATIMFVMGSIPFITGLLLLKPSRYRRLSIPN